MLLLWLIHILRDTFPFYVYEVLFLIDVILKFLVNVFIQFHKADL